MFDTQPDHLTMYSNTWTCFFCFWSFFSSEAETLTKIKTFVTGVKSHFVPKIIPFCIHVFYHYYYCCKITFRLCFYFHYFSLLFTQFKPLQPKNKTNAIKLLMVKRAYVYLLWENRIKAFLLFVKAPEETRYVNYFLFSAFIYMCAERHLSTHTRKIREAIV